MLGAARVRDGAVLTLVRPGDVGRVPARLVRGRDRVRGWVRGRVRVRVRRPSAPCVRRALGRAR